MNAALVGAKKVLPTVFVLSSVLSMPVACSAAGSGSGVGALQRDLLAYKARLCVNERHCCKQTQTKSASLLEVTRLQGRQQHVELPFGCQQLRDGRAGLHGPNWVDWVGD